MLKDAQRQRSSFIQCSVLISPLQMLRLLKQPSLTEMAMAAVKQHKESGGGAGASSSSNSAAALASAIGKSTGTSGSIKPILKADGSVDEAATRAAATAAQHKFWDTQPVPKLGQCSNRSYHCDFKVAQGDLSCLLTFNRECT